MRLWRTSSQKLKRVSRRDGKGRGLERYCTYFRYDVWAPQKGSRMEDPITQDVPIDDGLEVSSREKITGDTTTVALMVRKMTALNSAPTDSNNPRPHSAPFPNRF